MVAEMWSQASGSFPFRNAAARSTQWSEVNWIPNYRCSSFCLLFSFIVTPLYCAGNRTLCMHSTPCSLCVSYGRAWVSRYRKDVLAQYVHSLHKQPKKRLNHLIYCHHHHQASSSSLLLILFLLSLSKVTRTCLPNTVHTFRPDFLLVCVCVHVACIVMIIHAIFHSWQCAFPVHGCLNWLNLYNTLSNGAKCNM